MFESTDSAHKWYGKYPGVVVANAPEKAGAPFDGDILVRVSGIRDEERRPIEVWAKPCFHPGFFFIPEPDDHVWVEFIAGDIDFAIWTGVWYPQGKSPQTVDGEDPAAEQKVLRTVSGHVLTLDDDTGKIVVADRNGNRLTLDETGVTIDDQAGNRIVMADDGVKVVDKSSNEVVMGAGGVTVKSNAIRLGSDTAAEPLVLGSQWMQLFNSHVHIGNMGAPTSTPLAAGTPATPAQLSAKHKTE